MIFGLLTRSAQFVKCASGTSFIPRLFAHSIYEAEPKLGACIEIAEWKGGSESLENALFAEADCVTATGSDETLETIRKRLPQKTRFFGYGHRVSFGYVTEQILSGMNPQKTVSRAATDVVAWNQLGCLSPHVIYVESGGAISPEKFAELLVGGIARNGTNPTARQIIHGGIGQYRVPTLILRSARRAFAGHKNVVQHGINGLDGDF